MKTQKSISKKKKSISRKQKRKSNKIIIEITGLFGGFRKKHCIHEKVLIGCFKKINIQKTKKKS